MNLKHYRIVSGSGMSLEDAKTILKEKLIEECNHGWKLQGGASVQEKDLDKCTWYDLYQTIIPGKQKLSDYDIIYVKAPYASLSEATDRIKDLAIEKYRNGWEIQGGATVDSEIIQEKSNWPNYKIYQTVIKKE